MKITSSFYNDKKSSVGNSKTLSSYMARWEQLWDKSLTPCSFCYHTCVFALCECASVTSSSIIFFQIISHEAKKHTFYSQRFGCGNIIKNHLWKREKLVWLLPALLLNLFEYCLLYINILWPELLAIELLNIVSGNRIMKTLKWFYLWFWTNWLFKSSNTVFKGYYNLP